MRLKKKIRQHRRDFQAIYECEHCNQEIEASGYDDHNFHVNVIPNMICHNCGETANPSTPKTMPDVPSHAVI